MKMKFYTWKDIERYFLLNRVTWEDAISSIDVYPNDITVYARQGACEKAWETIQAMFGANYIPQNKEIKLDIGKHALPIDVQEGESVPRGKKVLPLFENILYQTSSYPTQKPEPLSHPIIAFHSYKGGVGRTLSLLAFAKAWSAVFGNSDTKRLLIIDSDIEAPGMTWLQEDRSDDTFSY